VRLAHLPTPLDDAPRLARALGLARLSVKREDLTGLAGGGNKARKLQALVTDAQTQGCDVLLTSGALQSNFCRMTAAAAARAGLDCELVLDAAVTGAGEPYARGGNVLLDELLGATLVLPDDLPLQAAAPLVARPLLGDEDAFIVRGVAAREAALRADGRRPYVMPPGGSSPVGAGAYDGCARELLEQVPDVTHVVTATTTGGTQAGLTRGLVGRASVIGISAALDAATTATLVGWLSDGTGEVEVDDRFVGPGYGVPTPEGREALVLAARTEGLLLDPVYSAKALAGLRVLAAEGRFGPEDHVVFVATGGLPSLFAYPRDVLR
jgi:1-aminocyclopropane-1-carboxylate deaminase/D-cysteine desulfhydrase-like pyridoxal-dependent ACC family enzyme